MVTEEGTVAVDTTENGATTDVDMAADDILDFLGIDGIREIIATSDIERQLIVKDLQVMAEAITKLLTKIEKYCSSSLKMDQTSHKN